MGNYVTASEVKAFKVNGQPALGGCEYTDVELEEEIALAEEIIESITGDIFYEKTETNKFDGNGLVKLFFIPKIPYKLLTVVSVKDIDIDGVVLDTLIENEDFVRYDFYLNLAMGWPEDSPRRGVFRGGRWPFGQQNIVVEGTWGATETPLQIKRATILLVLERLLPGSTQQGTPVDVTQAVWNDFTISFKAKLQVGMSTGYSEVDRLLERFVNYSSLMLVVPDAKQTYDNPRTDP